jgi:phosphonate transport system substrate-binding protein
MSESPQQPPVLLSVCPHDTAKNQLGWFTLNTYLQRKLSVRIHFEPQDDFLKERAHVLATPHHLVYANPYSAAVFARDQGFQCVARPVGVFDECLIVAKPDFDPAAAARPLKLGSASDKLITHHQGIDLMKELGFGEVDMEFTFVGNHMNAIKAVLDGRVSAAIVFNETWLGASALTRSALKVVAESKAQQAFHCFMASPAWADRIPELQAILCAMQDEAQGKAILEDLKIRGFEAVPPECAKHLEQYV